MDGIFIPFPYFIGWLFLVLGPLLLWNVFVSSKKPRNSSEFLFKNRSFNATKLMMAVIIFNLLGNSQRTVLAGPLFYWFSQLLLFFGLFLLIYYYLHSPKKLSLFGFNFGKLPVYLLIVFFVLTLVWTLLGNKGSVLAFPYSFYFISLLVLLVHYIKRPKNVD